MSTVEAQNWKFVENTAVIPAVNFVNTPENIPLDFRTNNLTRMIICGNGFVSIGTFSPVSRLAILGQIKITDCIQCAGKELSPDKNGLTTWQAPSGCSAHAWSRFGITGIIDGTHILGTKTIVPLSIHVNNHKAVRSDPL